MRSQSSESRDPRGAMSKSAATAAVFGACEILTDLRYSRDETKTTAAIKELSQLLYLNPQERASLFQATWSRGGVTALLGILRSTQSIPLLANAARCLALLIQDNSSAAQQLVACDILSVLLPLLFPHAEKPATPTTVDSPYPLSSPLSWPRQRLPVYEMVLAVIRKLTYHSPSLQKTFAERGGIKLIIKLSSSPDFISTCSSFSIAARDKLVSLTLGKKLICHAALVPEGSRNDVLRCFPSLFSSIGLSSLYPSYVVDLMTDDERWIVDTLVESQEVWPCHTPFPKGVESVWTCVSVTCVQDGGHVWCQFCLDRPKPKISAMATILREMAPPTEKDHAIPEVGELCLAYFDPSNCHAPSCIDVPSWGRGRLLRVEPGANLYILSIDYGVTATLPLSHIHPLPPECKGIPPLAIPCKLLGVSPIPVCTVVQENAAGILRNLAFESVALRKEIIAFGGVEALLKLSLSCDVGVATQAMAALLNMATSEEEKREMGQRAAVDTLLVLVLQTPPHPSLLPLSLGALYTLTIHSHHNQRRLLNLKAVERLSSMLTNDDLGGKERETMMALLKVLDPSFTIGRPQSQIGNREISLKKRTVCTSPATSGTSGPSGEGPRQVRAQLRRPVHSGGSGKRGVVYRCLGDQDSCEQGLVTSEVKEGGASGGVVTDQIYVYDSFLPFQEDDVHSFKDVDSVRDITRGMLIRSVCAMINSGQLCTIYVGVSSEGRVRGVKLSQKDRDSLGIVIDRLLYRTFSPPIHHHRYKLMFVPVVSGSHTARAPPQTYVLQLEIRGRGGSRKEVYTIVRERDGQRTELCYSRCGKSDVRTSPQELRDRLARQESSCHGNEISSLLQNISTLKVTLDKITTKNTPPDKLPPSS